MAKAFASQGDLAEKEISFTEVGKDLWAFTAEGDPNSGVIIGDDSVMIVEAQATPRLANNWLKNRVSAKFGILVSVSGSLVSNVAAMSFNAEFFAPEIGIVPLSVRPPVIFKLSILGFYTRPHGERKAQMRQLLCG